MRGVLEHGVPRLRQSRAFFCVVQLKKGQKAPWYDRELTQQMRRKDRAYHKWKRHPCYDNWEAFKSLKREYNRMLKRKRAAFAQSSSDGATVTVAASAVDERTKAGVPEEEQTAEGDVEATPADSPEVAIVDAAESSCDSTTLPLEVSSALAVLLVFLLCGYGLFWNGSLVCVLIYLLMRNVRYRPNSARKASRGSVMSYCGVARRGYAKMLLDVMQC